MQITRRTFLRQLALAPAALSWVRRAAGESPAAPRLRFGLVADVHQDVMPDVVQLGDFCQPQPGNQPFLDAWNRFAGPRHHVLGNHDTDGGAKPEQTIAFYGMKSAYYAFDAGPMRGLVLNGNEHGGRAKGYARFVGPEQLAWIKREMDAADRPALLFIHQPPDDPSGLENGAAVRAVLEAAEAARPGAVAAVFTGHLHQDYERELNGIRYVQINSASYVWLPAAAARETFAPEVHRAHPSLRQVAAYREPLWALATLDFERGTLELEGRHSEWVGPDPWARGAPEAAYPRDRVQPRISDRRFRRT